MSVILLFYSGTSAALLYSVLHSTITAFCLVETLQFSHTMLSGSLPTEIGLLTNLVSVELNNNAIVGPLPSEIGMLPC